MRAAVLVGAALVACAVAASPRDVWFWHLSGDDFVKQMIGESNVSKWDQSAKATYEQRFAEGYQAGVVDATQGKLWCAPPRMKPAEVDDRIWAELRKRQGTMHGNAAETLIELYAARFPCNR